MSIVDIHARLAITALLYAIILGLWGLWRYFRKQGVEGSYWGALVIAEVIFLVQGIIGVYLFFSGGTLNRPFVHILYGVVSVLTIPGIFLFTRGDDSRRSMGIYGVACFFLMGIALRSISTGGE